LRLGEAINYDKLFNNQDQNAQVFELKKVLLLAGIDITTDLYDPDIMRAIQEVLSRFDPSSDSIEQDLVLQSRIMRNDTRFLKGAKP
jgi:hypothetical protein